MKKNQCIQIVNAIKDHPQVKPRSWLESEPKSYGGAMLRAWYKSNPQFIDESK